MPNTDIIVACASCGTQYNVSSMAPGAKFKCQRCGTINIVPAAEEPIQDLIPPPPPRAPARIQAKQPVKTGPKPTPAPSRISGSRIPASRSSAPLKKGKSLSRTSEEGEEAEVTAKKGGILAKENRKYFYIGGAVLLVIFGMVYVVHSNSVHERNTQIAEKANKAITEINELVSRKDFVKALEKSEAFIKEFNEYDLPKVKDNVENTKKSIHGIEQTIAREKEGTAKLKELLDKKDDASPDQYDDLAKELGKFATKYGEFNRLFEKANSAAKDLEAKAAAKQEEEDNKIYNELMSEIKPMVDSGKIDNAIAHLKKYWDNNSLSKRLQSLLKKKLSDLKAMK